MTMSSNALCCLVLKPRRPLAASLGSLATEAGAGAATCITVTAAAA